MFCASIFNSVGLKDVKNSIIELKVVGIHHQPCGNFLRTKMTRFTLISGQKFYIRPKYSLYVSQAPPGHF